MANDEWRIEGLIGVRHWSPVSRGTEGGGLELARGGGEGGEGGEDEGIVGPEGLGVGDPGGEAEHAGAGELEFDVAAGAELRRVGFHRGRPGGDDGGIGEVDEQGLGVGGLGVGRDGVEEELADGVRRLVAKFGQAAVAGEPRGVAHELAEAPVVGVLVGHERGGEDDGGSVPAQETGERDRVRGLHLEVRVAVELEEFEGDAEERGGTLGLGGALGGGAVGAGFAAGADDAVRGAARAGLGGEDAAATEFQIVGMSAEGEERSGHGKCGLRNAECGVAAGMTNGE